MYRCQRTRHKFPTLFALRIRHQLIAEMRRAKGEEAAQTGKRLGLVETNLACAPCGST